MRLAARRTSRGCYGRTGNRRPSFAATNGKVIMKHTLTISIPAKNQPCRIIIGNTIINSIDTLHEWKSCSSIVIVCDQAVGSIAHRIKDQLPVPSTVLMIPGGDKHKTINSVETIWKHLHEVGADRRSLLINIGGGTVTDLGGFAASTYMRGIAWINIPTTLLAQVDASIGGKTGCNFNGVKNLIGTTMQPIMIIIDPTALRHLPPRELTAGFGEIIKHGVIADKNFLQYACRKKPTRYTMAELTSIIVASCEIKQTIVEQDPYEQGSRKLVNFGHTIGHAIESLSLTTSTPLLHGEAIAIGMVYETRLAHLYGLLAAKDYLAIRTYVKQAGLPIQYDAPADKLIATMKSDKKNQAGHINFTLVTTIGHAITDQYPPEDTILRALSS